MLIRTLLLVLVVAMLPACTTKSSVKVKELNTHDKELSCREIQLEVNEAEFYRRTAEKNKNPEMMSLLMPIGYITSYIDAQDAVQAADSRIDYLNRVYDIMKCEQKAGQNYVVQRNTRKLPQVENAPVAYNRVSSQVSTTYYAQQPYPAQQQVQPVGYIDEYYPNTSQEPYVPPMNYNPHNFW